MEITGWIASIVGAAVLTLLADIILPEGEMNSYIKGVLSIFIVFIIAFPLPELLSGKVTFEEIWGESQETFLDEELIERLNESRREGYEERIEAILEKEGISGCVVTVTLVIEDGLADITKVFINTEKAVITDKYGNINISWKIKNTVSTQMGIKEEVILVGKSADYAVKAEMGLS